MSPKAHDMKEERVQKKSTTLYFSKPVWLALKNAAAEQDTSMTALAEEILADRLGVSVIHPIDADPGGAHDEPTTEEERLLMELEGLESEGGHRKDPTAGPKTTRARKRARQGNG